MAWPRRCGRIETEFLPRDGVAPQFTELRVQGRRSKLHSSWCKWPFLGSPPVGFIPSLHFHQPWGAVSTGWSHRSLPPVCPQAGPTAHCHRSVRRLVPPLTPTGLPRGTHSAFANLQNVFLSQLHLYICLFCISKACFLDKFINILAGALSPCKSLSPTHMPTLPARLHSCFSTCSSRVGDPVVVCLPRSLLLNLHLSLPSSLFSLSFPSALIHSSALCIPLQRVRTHFTPLQTSSFSIHSQLCVSGKFLMFCPYTDSYDHIHLSYTVMSFSNTEVYMAFSPRRTSQNPGLVHSACLTPL